MKYKFSLFFNQTIFTQISWTVGTNLAKKLRPILKRLNHLNTVITGSCFAWMEKYLGQRPKPSAGFRSWHAKGIVNSNYIKPFLALWCWNCAMRSKQKRHFKVGLSSARLNIVWLGFGSVCILCQWKSRAKEVFCTNNPLCCIHFWGPYVTHKGESDLKMSEK